MSHRPEFQFALDPEAAEPLFLQLAQAIIADVRRGRLRKGDRLPGSRTLAESLAVHRNTVVAALEELKAQGWLRTAAGRGTFISTALPEVTASSRHQAVEPPRARLGFDLGPPPSYERDTLIAEPLSRGTLGMLGGVPDLRLLPTEALSRAYRRVVRARGRELFRYDDPRGDETLRESLARLLAQRRGLSGDGRSLLLTRGSQMALYLVARALVRPGEVVAVEALGYRPAWAALREAGAVLRPLPVDESGLDVAALAALCEKERVRAVYLTPHHQYPTTAMLAPGRRMSLLALARARRLAILEDDYDHEFHYDGRPVLPLASADRAGTVVYVGTLSKLLAPGLRIGFVWAAEPLLERLAALRTVIDRQGDHAVQRAVAELLDDGEVERHAWRCRRAYFSRRQRLAELLTKKLGGALSFRLPAGGMALWAQAAPDLDVEAWLSCGRERGVVFQPGRRFCFHERALPFLRLGFACLNERELGEAVKRLDLALSDLRRQRQRRQ